MTDSACVRLSVGLAAAGFMAINSASISTLLSSLDVLCLQRPPQASAAWAMLAAALHLPSFPSLPEAPGPAQSPQMPLLTLLEEV